MDFQSSKNPEERQERLAREGRTSRDDEHSERDAALKRERLYNPFQSSVNQFSFHHRSFHHVHEPLTWRRRPVNGTNEDKNRKSMLRTTPSTRTKLNDLSDGGQKRIRTSPGSTVSANGVQSSPKVSTVCNGRAATTNRGHGAKHSTDEYRSEQSHGDTQRRRPIFPRDARDDTNRKPKQHDGTHDAGDNDANDNLWNDKWDRQETQVNAVSANDTARTANKNATLQITTMPELTATLPTFSGVRSESAKPMLAAFHFRRGSVSEFSYARKFDRRTTSTTGETTSARPLLRNSSTRIEPAKNATKDDHQPSKPTRNSADTCARCLLRRHRAKDCTKPDTRTEEQKAAAAQQREERRAKSAPTAS
ncbi:hypothetical protein HPB50_012866 [Hyalomma asiaticum]|uniref:Uncharacterized protein n=1 Tax=Hyalomma asiaticum TaxID=266040 RepID=A0ACB7TFM7_HYAAI|nr:hypothetical protein HPB50_012866 [Hyalomma asiaticum]